MAQFLKELIRACQLGLESMVGHIAERPYKEEILPSGQLEKIMDYGCGTLGDMGVHIFDTPYNALQLDVPRTITNNCRQPTGFGFPENNIVT